MYEAPNATPEPRFSVVIPCYDEEHGILPALDTLQQALSGTGPYEVLVIDDGSVDRTPERLAEAGARFPHLRVLRHERNLGYGAALKTGIRRASAGLIIITDADGTYPAEAIPRLLAVADEYEMVVGARTGDDVSYPFVRRIPKVLLRALAVWITGKAIPDLNSGLRLFRRSLAERFIPLLPDGFSFTTSITIALLRHDYRVSFQPIDYAPRTGRSKIQPVRDSLLIASQIVRIGMYLAPLRLLMPLVVALSFAFLVSLGFDLFVLKNLTDKTILFLTSAMNTLLFALLADMIDRRSPD